MRGMKNLGIEIERKYLLNAEQKKNILEKIPNRQIGIIQWYIDDAKRLLSSERIRLSISAEENVFSHSWIYGSKKF